MSFFAVLIFLVFANAESKTPFLPCPDDKARLEVRSKELEAIVKADQDDRTGVDWTKLSPEEGQKHLKQDETRRKRVGEIFGEGCFAKASDYAAAALVYQHGIVPDHFFQAFIWTQKAVELGDKTQERMLALTIDRYLVKSGRKQLFGSQASMTNIKADSCWCLDQVEKSFPDARRKQLVGKTLSDMMGWVKELNAGRNCASVRECEVKLKSTPKGSVVGFW